MPSEYKIEKKFLENRALRFECQGSGKCCLSRGGYGFVYLTSEDRQRLAQHLNLTIGEFTKKYCGKTDGLFHLVEYPGRKECIFLDNKRCSVYKGRPTQCRTWPFWPENMNAKAWKKDVGSFCPGVGQGKLVSIKKIKKQLQEQIESDLELYGE